MDITTLLHQILKLFEKKEIIPLPPSVNQIVLQTSKLILHTYLHMYIIISLFSGVAGTQATKMSANSVIVFKMHNLHPIKRKVKENEDDDSDEESDDEDDAGEDPEKEPKLKIAALKHNGCINRIR